MTTHASERSTPSVADDARRARRTAGDLLRDGGYATIGVTDAAVSYVRRLGTRAGRVREELSSLSRRRPSDLSASLRDLGAGVEQQLESFAGRGREVVASLQRNRATQLATERARIARGQVGAARTSVRRAGASAGEAVEQGATDIADGTAVDYEAMTIGELRDMARARGIEGRSDMNKAELVRVLRAS